MFGYIVLTAFGGLVSIWGWAAYTVSQIKFDIELDFSVEDFVDEMYAGHRYGRDD
jgi:hypothetical protein